MFVQVCSGFVELPDLFSVLEFVRKIILCLAGLFKRNDVVVALIRPLEDLNFGWRLHVVVKLAVCEHVDIQILLNYLFFIVFD